MCSLHTCGLPLFDRIQPSVTWDIIFGSLSKLWDVQLCDNQITDISPLSGLELRILLLGNNPVEDYSPVADTFERLEAKDFELE